MFYAHHPDFKVPCGIDGCQRNFTNIRTYQNHVSSIHNWCKDNHISNEEGSTVAMLSDHDEDHDSDECSDFRQIVKNIDLYT